MLRWQHFQRVDFGQTLESIHGDLFDFCGVKSHKGQSLKHPTQMTKLALIKQKIFDKQFILHLAWT